MDEGTPNHHRAWEAIAVGILVIIIAGAGFALYRHLGRTPGPSSPTAKTPPPPPSVTGADLGTEIYEKSSNPISGKLPKTVAPLPNPIQSVYKNPFQ